MTKRNELSEAGWLSAGSACALLRELQQHHGVARTAGGRRRLRLFACACCRQSWHLFTDQDSRQAVEVAERYADGRASRGQVEAARRSAEAAAQRAMARVLELMGGRTSWDGPLPPSLVAAQQARGTAAAAVATVAPGHLARAGESAALQCVLAAGAGKDRWEDGRPVQHAVEALQCGLLRDLFNPFRPLPAIAPTVLSWHGGAIVKLATAVYEGRELPSGHLDAARLAILADMLEEAGATDPHLLGHLRSAGPHVRGCLAVDALLGKS